MLRAAAGDVNGRRRRLASAGAPWGTIEAVQERGEPLVDQARRGDGEALERLLLAHQPRLYRVARRLCRDEAEAEDVQQEALLLAARALARFRGEASFDTWLFTIARRVCHRRRRLRSGEPTPSHRVSLETAAPSLWDRGPLPDEAASARWTAEAVARALAALEPRQREVVVLRDVEGCSAAETAALLGIGEGAVKSRLHRARAALRSSLAPLVGRPLPLPAVVPRLCPGILAYLSRHREGDITPRSCAQLERHLAGCGWCRHEAGAFERSLSLCQAAGAGPVPRAVRRQLRQALRRLARG